MAALVTLWQLRKLASYSAFFPVCLVEERNDFYLQELHSSNSRFVIHGYGCTDSEPGYSNTRVRREKRWSTAGICRPRTGSGTQNPSGNASLPSSLHCSMTRLPPSRQYTRAEESECKTACPADPAWLLPGHTALCSGFPRSRPARHLSAVHIAWWVTLMKRAPPRY